MCSGLKEFGKTDLKFVVIGKILVLSKDEGMSKKCHIVSWLKRRLRSSRLLLPEPYLSRHDLWLELLGILRLNSLCREYCRWRQSVKLVNIKHVSPR